MDPAGKRFFDREIAEIIKRASTIQGGEGAQSGEEGVSLEELVSIGGELGISAEAIHAAVYAVAFGSPDSRIPFLGESVTATSSRTVAAKASTNQLLELSAALTQIIGEQGTSTTAGGIVTWKSDPFVALRKGFDMRVEVRPLRSGAHVTVRENLGAIAVGLFGGIGGGFGIGVGVGVGIGVGVGALGSVLFATLFPIGILAISYFGARFLYRSIVSIHRAKVTALTEKICSIMKGDDNFAESPQLMEPKGS
ncbi:MAG: hypothetical protein JSV89_00595 [Spirochaetaceae bacterium]|nr:MAG: hypothetical protein JSV89_00595 [Spirochaetaceae bacterium]